MIKVAMTIYLLHYILVQEHKGLSWTGLALCFILFFLEAYTVGFIRIITFFFSPVKGDLILLFLPAPLFPRFFCYCVDIGRAVNTLAGEA
jgi:hypothetical protein